MKIAFSQINSILGNVDHNSKLILRDIERAKARKADLLVFPELALIGYLPQDLLEQKNLLNASNKALAKLAKKVPKGMKVVIGSISCDNKKRLYNSAFVLSSQKIEKTISKVLFPNYDVFDEARYFYKGDVKKNFIRVKGKSILLSVCEDIWAFHPRYKNKYPPLYKEVKKKADLVVNISASPYTKEKKKDRLLAAKNAAKYFSAPVLYVNLVGGQDELIFDGRSFYLDKKAKVLTQSLAFEEDLNFVNTKTNEVGHRHRVKAKPLADLKSAIVLGIRDFVQKNSFQKVHLGLSGGIDSALVACLAADALGPHNVTCVAMPTQFNASESLSLAKELAENLGCDFHVVEIESMFKTFSKNLESAWGVKDFGLMHENLQSRIRGMTLMSYSNTQASLLLTTGNKSEFAMGYATLYGDMCGALAPIGDLLKQEVVDLCRLYNEEYKLIPDRIIDRPPSAELRPNQKDSDSLPPYEVLDKQVNDFICEEKNLSGKEGKTLMRQIMMNEFKRRQAPPILKISKRAFGRGRRYPITQQLL